MSKRNKLKTRRAAHEYDLQRTLLFPRNCANRELHEQGTQGHVNLNIHDKLRAVIFVGCPCSRICPCTRLSYPVHLEFWARTRAHLMNRGHILAQVGSHDQRKSHLDSAITALQSFEQQSHQCMAVLRAPLMRPTKNPDVL
jgi:hypothetical protein